MTTTLTPTTTPTPSNDRTALRVTQVRVLFSESVSYTHLTLPTKA